MASITWDDVLPLIVPELPTCPEATIKEYLPIVASEFFARTFLWRAPLIDAATVAGQAEYDMCSDGFDTVIESVLWLKVDGRAMTHTDPRLVDPELMDTAGRPTRFWIERDRAIRLMYIPDDVFPITGEVVLKPTRVAQTMPQWVYETWIDTLVSGTIYRLCRLRGKDWSDPEFAAIHKNLYEQGVTNARIRDMRNVRQQVRMKRF